MLRECVRLAREEQRVVVFLEPIALYMMRDLHEPQDGLWMAPYDAPGQSPALRLGDVGQYGKGKDLCILTYGNGYYLARQAAKALEDEHGIKLRIIDLRWLNPLPEAQILAAIKPCKNVLIVDECRNAGSLSEGLMALIYEKMKTPPRLARLTATDCFIALGRASTLTLPSKDSIIQAALKLMGAKK